MARIAVLGSLVASDDILPLRRVGEHSLLLKVPRPGEHLRADVLLMDDAGFNSYDVHEIEDDAPIIVATSDPTACTRLLDLGASAVIALPVDAAELTSAIYTLITPGRYLSGRVVAALIGNPGGVHSSLSGRENDVLTHLAAGRSDVEIADALFISPATVHTHILNLRRKLDARNRTHAVVLAIQRGIIAPRVPAL